MRIVDKSKIKIKSKKNILVSKILFYVGLIFSVLLVFAFFFKILINKINIAKTQTAKIKSETMAIINEEKELDRKAYLTKIYINLWRNEISKEQKSLNGVDIEKIKNLLNDIATKHYLLNLQTSLSLPTPIDFKKNSVNFANTEITVSFNCLTEFAVYYFLKNLREAKLGFPIIEEVKIKKVKNLNKDIVSSLVNGTLDYLLEANIKIQWYNALEKN